MSPRRVGEAGAATTELVLVFPAVLLFVLLVFQFALWLHAANVVEAAAQDGARAARVEGGTAEDARVAARALLGSSDASLAGRVLVDAERTEAEVRVRVRGDVVAVVPGLQLRVDAASRAPVEEFR